MTTLTKSTVVVPPVVEEAQRYLDPTAIEYVFYHAGCSDGFAARWVAQTALGPECKYVPFYYYNPPLFDDLREKTVLFVDCALKPRQLKSLQNDYGAKTLVLDHHQSAKDAYLKSPTLGIFIDTTHCAAVLAWYYFYGETKPIPQFLHFIEDRDLWLWRLPESRAFMAAFMELVPFDVNAYSLCADETNGDARCKTLIKQGNLILEYQNKRVLQLVKHASVRQFGGKRVAMLNCTEMSLVSDLGNMLAKQDGIDFAMLWYYNGANKCIHVSLRSDGSTDVQKIASQTHLGGGGHPCAAGFVWFDQNIETLFDYPTNSNDSSSPSPLIVDTYH